MQTIATHLIQKKIKATPLTKLLWWSLIIHFMIFFLFWNTQPDAYVQAGRPLSVLLESSIQKNSLSTTKTDKAAKAEKKYTRTIKNNISSIPTARKKLPTVSASQKTKLAEDHKQTNALPQQVANPKLEQKFAVETKNRLQTSLGKHLSEYFKYPRIARRKGWQGQVMLGLRIEGDGQLSHIRLAQSSGYATLDNAALDSLRKLAYLPKAKSWLAGRYHDLVIPVEYRLIDG